MVTDDFCFIKTHLKTMEVISFSRNTFNDAFLIRQNYSKIHVWHCGNSKFSGRNALQREGNYRGGEGRRQNGKGKREREEMMERGGMEGGWGWLCPQGRGIDALGRCHSK
jgi:hypothetical protein